MLPVKKSYLQDIIEKYGNLPPPLLPSSSMLLPSLMTKSYIHIQVEPMSAEPPQPGEFSIVYRCSDSTIVAYVTETGEYIDDGKADQIVGNAKPGMLPAPHTIGLEVENGIKVEVKTYDPKSALTFKEYMKQCDKMKERKY